MEKVFAMTGMVIVISALSIRLTRRFKIPILAVYLIFGMFLGSFGIDFGFFGSYVGMQTISTIALCYILFSGAMEMQLDGVRNIQREGLVLATFGIVMTTLIVGAFVKLALPSFSWLESFLFGTVVSSTDAAAVMAALDFRRVNISDDIKNLLKFESGSNDPMAFTLLVSFLSLLLGKSHSISFSLFSIVTGLIFGMIWGVVFARIGLFLLNRLSVKIYEFDHILILGLVIVTFSLSQLFYGNGFLSVYVFGLYLSKDDFQYKKSTARFYSTISGVLQIFMFIGLGVLVDIKTLLNLWEEGLFLALTLIFVARPLAVACSLIPFRKYSWRDQVFISWGGLKGAVPIVFATYPVVEGLPDGNIIFHLVFFCVLVSILLQGPTLDTLANILNASNHEKDDEKEPNDGDFTHSIGLDTIENIEENLVEIKIMRQPLFLNQKVKDIALPKGTLIITVERDSSYFSPVGDTEILEGDLVFILAPNKEEFQKFLKERYKTQPKLENPSQSDESSPAQP